MSEHIVHTGICDDSIRLVAAAGPHLPPLFNQVMTEHRDLARLGAITRHADRHAVGLLRGWREHTNDPSMHPKLAFLLAWLSHRAADRQFKPVFRAVEPDSLESPKECSIYHDCWLWRRRYSGHDPDYGDEVFLRNANGHQGEAVAGLRSLIRALLQGSLIALHTLHPPQQDVDGWLDSLVAVHQRWCIDMNRYVAAALHPDPEKIERFITATRFYDPKDPLIALCENLQSGAQTEPDHVLAAAAMPQGSRYGQTLATAWSYIRAAGAYWQGSISEAALSEALDHGKLGRDGKPV